ncbi:alpha/beta fold hydrolase [Solibacillus daqui]|uniref:alpha/beta fold hydrolase n=1 Tax=Solibacillus daqui TaxID=2912187 RepID=UPI0023668BBC|nr:alpha/beta fold hydrolase [Solibacillus daqui]
MLHYKIYSHQHKEWVVLVHGAGGSSTIWYKQIRAYRKHFNVLVVDLRGHGACKIENSPTKYTLDLVSQDILKVLDSLDIEKAHFVGISLGTMLIRHLAESNPERFHTMVLAGAVYVLHPSSIFYLA